MTLYTCDSFTKSKHDAAVKFAKAKGLPEPKHVLIPRTKGFVATVQGLRDDLLDAVYDVTIWYPNKKFPTLRR